ncbi:MAG: hypothetical protein SF162_01030 [bacterium]|nr:hypothetical protein [bacterium]
MNRKRLPKRGHKLIAFKAFFDTDRDILEWWDAMQDGERSEVMRDILRVYLKGLPLIEAARRKAIPVDGTVVLQVRDDTAWIREALTDMPAYLEALLGRMTVVTAPVSAAQNMTEQSDSSLTDDALVRRRAKMGKAGW